ncbi:MAG: MotA/TolQ/ExbB proton channel family protein [Proteobacteria bacterium]|nr:MotA/TolQ/ExbB proton channel family protein [Pseudomonadota bacterium]
MLHFAVSLQESTGLEAAMQSFALLGAGWVLWLLVFLSVGCITISLGRAIYMLRNGTKRATLLGAVDRFLGDGDTVALTKSLDGLKGYEARVLGAGIQVSEMGPVAVERAMAGTVSSEKLNMERGLSFLATVGSNAPFIGLFGTVLGIIQAFHDLAKDVAAASEAVMAGISEALIATAVGLMVAIPAVVLYNLFVRWVRNRIGRTESLAQLVLARLEGETNHGG